SAPEVSAPEVPAPPVSRPAPAAPRPAQRAVRPGVPRLAARPVLTHAAPGNNSAGAREDETEEF
ncbi:MAG TPA: hypothetical protein VNO23_01675, partial [Candidatus Binatia bacterium]|nr:hypothetical protein [Candidatus Binatia bacterium]